MSLIVFNEKFYIFYRFKVVWHVLPNMGTHVINLVGPYLCSSMSHMGIISLSGMMSMYG